MRPKKAEPRCRRQHPAAVTSSSFLRKGPDFCPGSGIGSGISGETMDGSGACGSSAHSDQGKQVVVVTSGLSGHPGAVSQPERSPSAPGATQRRQPSGGGSRREGKRGAKDSSLPRLVSPMHGAKIGCNDISPTHCLELARLCRTQTLWQELSCTM